MKKINENLPASVGVFGKVRKFGVPALITLGVVLKAKADGDTSLADGIAAGSAGALAVKTAVAAAAVTVIGYGVGLRGIKIGAMWVWNLFARMAGR